MSRTVHPLAIHPALAAALAATLAAPILAGVARAAPPDARAPDDPRFDRQWALEQSTDLDLDAMTAWHMAAAAPEVREVVVAVIDSGLDIDHPDLAGRLWTNPHELPNGLDDDGDGIVDDLHGANWLTTGPDGAPVGRGEVFDQLLGHATAVAGNIAAESDNGFSVSGVAGPLPVRLMPLVVIDLSDFAGQITGGDAADGDLLAARYADAIEYALDHGANVINISSAAVPPADRAVRRRLAALIARAEAEGVPIVSAVLNAPVELPPMPADWVERLPAPLAPDCVPPVLPASIASPAIFSVSGVDRDGVLAWASSAAADPRCGHPAADTVLTAAGGVGVQSTWPLRDLLGVAQYAHGSSFAAPQVSAVIAMALSTTDLLDRPAPERLARLRAALIAGAKPLPDLAGRVASGGIVSAPRVLDALGLPRPRGPVAAFEAQVSADRAPATVELTALTPAWAESAAVQYAWDLGDGATAEGRSLTHRYAAGGAWPVRLTVTDADGRVDRSPPHVVDLLPTVGDHVVITLGGEAPLDVRGALVEGDLTVRTSAWGRRETDGEGVVISPAGEPIRVAFVTHWSAFGVASGRLTVELADGARFERSFVGAVSRRRADNSTRMTLGDLRWQVIDQG